ncbi:MAG: hypothetical protein QM811_17030 [Pirellulales bacterium]
MTAFVRISFLDFQKLLRMPQRPKTAWLLCGILVVHLCRLTASAQPGVDNSDLVRPAKSARVPAPKPEQVAAVKKQVLELFDTQIANAKKPIDKILLGHSMAKTADETADDPAARYVLMTLSRDMLMDAGTLDQALNTAERIVEIYDVERDAERLKILAKAAERTDLTKPQYETVLEAARAGADEAAKSDRYEVALEYARVAIDVAKKPRDPKLLKSATDLAKEITALQTDFAVIAAAKESLSKDPADPAANMQLGRWYWFRKNDAATGMEYMAKTADSPLKTAALADLANPTDAASRMALAEQWWNLVQATKDDAAKAKLSTRAMRWYMSAAEELSGLQKAKAEKRISELKPLVEKDALATTATAATKSAPPGKADPAPSSAKSATPKSAVLNKTQLAAWEKIMAKQAKIEIGGVEPYSFATPAEGFPFKTTPEIFKLYPSQIYAQQKDKYNGLAEITVLEDGYLMVACAVQGARERRRRLEGNALGGEGLRRQRLAEVGRARSRRQIDLERRRSVGLFRQTGQKRRDVEITLQQIQTAVRRRVHQGISTTALSNPNR